MLALGALVGIVLAFFSILENRAVGLLGLGAAMFITNVFTIGLVVGFFVASGVISQVEGEDFSWSTKVNWYVTGVIVSTLGTGFFLSLASSYVSPIIIIQIVVILRTIGWIVEMIGDRDMVTVWDIFGVFIVLFLAWFGLHNQMSSLAFIYFSAMRLNVGHDVKKIIRSKNNQVEQECIEGCRSDVAAYFFNHLMGFLFIGLLDSGVQVKDDNSNIGPASSLVKGYSTGAQYAVLALLASQRDMLNTILQLSFSGDAAILFIFLALTVVLITRLLLGDWFINVYNKLANLKAFTILSYLSIGFNIFVMLTVSPYALLYIVAGILVCNLCNKYVKRISLTALPAFGVFG